MQKQDIIFRQNQAIELIKLGFKTRIVSIHTNLPISFVRKLYREIYDRSPLPGQLAESDAIMKNRRALVEGSILLSIYKSLAGEVVHEKIELYRLAQAHQIYLTVRKALSLNESDFWRLISINDSWILARDLRSGLIKMQYCRCGCAYLQIAHQYTRMSCASCELLFLENNKRNSIATHQP